MIAEPAAQLRLLDLQATDTALAQLAHRRDTLPELAALATLSVHHEELRLQLVELQTQLADVIAEQSRVEAEVDAVRARATRDEQRMVNGGLPAKELESLQHEITSLSRRQQTLEDGVLEVMEQREELETAAAGVDAAIASAEQEQSELTAARDAAFADIDADRVAKDADRAQIAKEIPDDLLTLYEKVRTAGGGVGAALLRQRRCEGCRMELASSELSAVRSAAPEDVVRCENCRRILVRSSESGL